MKGKEIIWIIVFLALVVPAMAQVYKASEPLDIKIPCTYNGTFCSSSSSCNLTLFYPNGTNILNNVQMTNSGAYHNYTLNVNQTTELGEYTPTFCCRDGSEASCKTLTYKITKSGKDADEGSALLYFGILIINLVIGLLCLLGSYKLNGNNEYDIGGKLLKINFNKYLKILLGFLAYLSLIILFYTGWKLSDLLTLELMDGIFYVFFTMSWLLLIPIVPFVFLLILFKVVLDLKLERYAERGVKLRDM